MALKKVKGSIDRIFDKNLQDLVRGIRNHKDNEAHFISMCIDEIKVELRQDNAAAKANAAKKLIYLQMLGYDISWAAFNVIEVMSSPKYTHKRIGYMTASQAFHVDTDVLMLATNMIRKDMSSPSVYDVGVALNGLSCFITPDLARDLANDLLSLMGSSKPYTRKRAVLISYKIFLNYPEALRPAFPRLKEKLEDPDPGVQSAAVNVICELARKNPKNYLSLAPVFFKLMTSSTNNWVLIKIIKLFGALTPLEPRLGKKLIEPLTNLIHNTSAMSLLYECINTVIQGMQDHSASIQGMTTMMKLCVQKLRILIEDSDQNLKYLGLLALSRILKSHPKAVQAHKDLILQCLDDKDESIRLRALDLLFGMVSKKNLMEIIKKLMVHVEKADNTQYRDELISKIVEICSQNNFHYITNFEWYMSILVELTRMDGSSHHGSLVSSQILDVAIRVKSIRPFAANQMAAMLENSHALTAQLKRNGMEEVLYAASYICGEFAQFIQNPLPLMSALLHPRILSLPAHIQRIYLHNFLKIYSVVLSKHEQEEAGAEEALAFTRTLLDKLPSFVQSSNLEVQERASTIMALLKQVEKVQAKKTPVASQVANLFKGELNPVAPKAQRKVPVPEGLNLDAWINEPPSSSEEEEEVTARKQSQFEQDYDEYYSPTRERQPLSPEELEKRKAARKVEQASNPNYLVPKKAAVEGYQNPDAEDLTDLGISEIDISIPLHVPGLSSSDRYFKMEQQRRRRHEAEQAEIRGKKKREKKGKKGRRGRREAEEKVEEEEEVDLAPSHQVEIVQEEMPEGAVKTDSEDDSKTKSDPFKALDMDLDEPYAASHALPQPQHHQVKPHTTAAVDNSADATAVPTHHKLSEKEKRREERKRKKEKKEKRRKNREKQEGNAEEHLVNGDDVTEAVNDVVAEDVSRVEKAEVKQQADDVSFWLQKDDVTTPPSIASPSNDVTARAESSLVNGEHGTGDDSSKRGKKKSKKNKEGKREKKKKKAKGEASEARAEDEGEDGATTQQQQRNYKLLCETSEMRIEFATIAIPDQPNKFLLCCLFTNLSLAPLSRLDFNVLDTLNTRLVRGGGGSNPVPIPFALPAMSRNECQLEMTAASVNMPQRMRGTVAYTTGDDRMQVEFKLHLPCSSYLVHTPCSSHHFAELLASGVVAEKSSMRIATSGMSFEQIIGKLCSVLKFTVVEQIGDSASLYTSSIQRHHLCLLVKNQPNGVTVDGKGDNLSILSNVIDEVKSLMSQP